MKNYTLRRLPIVEEDIFGAAAWYLEDGLEARIDLKFTAEVEAVIESLRTTAGQHRIRFRDVRRAPLQRFAFYGIYYVLLGGMAVVIAVFHDRRDRARLRQRRREIAGQL